MADHQPSPNGANLNKENQPVSVKSPSRDKSNEPESPKKKSPEPFSAGGGSNKEKTPPVGVKDPTPEPPSPKKARTPVVDSPGDENRKPDDSKEKSKTPERPVQQKAKTPDLPKPSTDDAKSKSPVDVADKDGKSPSVVGGADSSKKSYVSDDVLKTKDVIARRPDQDNTFDDNFVVKHYAPETKKDPAAVIIDPAVVQKNDTTTSVVGKQEIATPVTDEKSTERKSVGEKDPEILEFDESDIIIDEPDTLDPEEKKVLNDTKPVVEGFLAGYHKILEEGSKSPQGTRMSLSADQGTQTDRTPSPCIPMFHQEMLSPASQVGKQLSQIAVKFDSQYRPVVKTLVDHWLLELRRANDGQQPSFRSVWESFKKIVQEVFREGITWSRILILLMFVFEVFVHLYTMYVPKTAQVFIRCFLKSLVGFGVTRWVAKNGGWTVATVGVMHEQTMSAPSASVPSLHPPPGNELLRQPMVLAAAGVALAAGAYYWLFKK